jgi:membrane protein insertase Oxa1/YidC/SpoIIIJ
VPSRSYGFAIILLTVIVKVATYPLTKQQVGQPACSP